MLRLGTYTRAAILRAVVMPVGFLVWSAVAVYAYFESSSTSTLAPADLVCVAK